MPNGLAIENDDPQVREREWAQGFQNRFVEGTLDAPARFTAGVPPCRLIPRRDPTPDQLVMGRQRLVEGDGDVR